MGETALSSILKTGLAALGPNFSARICYFCDGQGSYEQTYTAGCGGGYFRMRGRCDHCEGVGLMQGRERAPASVVNQVQLAAARAALQKEEEGR